MSKQKPVWRMNKGVEPNDRLEDSPVLEVSGCLTESGYNNFNWSIDDNECYPIAAYQTTRTKAVKCERVECDCCGGRSLVMQCVKCNHKGYRLEVVK